MSHRENAHGKRSERGQASDDNRPLGGRLQYSLYRACHGRSPRHNHAAWRSRREGLPKAHGRQVARPTLPASPVRRNLGKTVWEGVVEVFALRGHPKATRAYAWEHATDDPAKPKHHVTVLHVHPVTSPILAVRAFILQEFRNLGTATEN